MTRHAFIAALLLVAAYLCNHTAADLGADPPTGCPIDAVRINPKTGHREQWETPAEWTVYHTPHGDVIITWDNVNDSLRIIGDELQQVRLAKNVLEISVIDEELP